MLERFFKTNQEKTTLLIRIMVGAVFLSEGIQKYLYPEIRGAGRFESIGLPMHEFLGYFVGGFEIICGVLILIGLATRFSSIPLIAIMLVAISSTKIPVLFEEGFWYMAHAARTDFSMLIGSIFLLIKGGGYWSMDLKYWGKENGKSSDMSASKSSAS
ncbi:MAG: DoxX family protein [Gracilimonas sp.]